MHMAPIESLAARCREVLDRHPLYFAPKGSKVIPLLSIVSIEAFSRRPGANGPTLEVRAGGETFHLDPADAQLLHSKLLVLPDTRARFSNPP